MGPSAYAYERTALDARAMRVHMAR